MNNILVGWTLLPLVCMLVVEVKDVVEVPKTPEVSDDLLKCLELL